MKLTKDSSHLVEFIEKKTQKYIKINKNSNNYLLNLLKQINYHYNNSKKFINTNVVQYNLVENLNVDFFIPKPILEVINKKCVNYFTIDIKINAAITFRIHLYFIKSYIVSRLNCIFISNTMLTAQFTFIFVTVLFWYFILLFVT